MIITVTKGESDFSRVAQGTVEAEPVTIEGFESIQLYVHERVLGFNDAVENAVCNANTNNASYTVTEHSTGMALCQDITKDGAISKAKKMLQGNGLEAMQVRIAHMLKELKKWNTTWKPIN